MARAEVELPVTVGGTVAGRSASIAVRFDRDVSQAVITVYGVDGVRISAPLTAGAMPSRCLTVAQARRGQLRRMSVTFSAASAGGLNGWIVVLVRGTVNGVPLKQIRLLRVGHPRVQHSGRLVESKGRRIIEQPATVVK